MAFLSTVEASSWSVTSTGSSIIVTSSPSEASVASISPIPESTPIVSVVTTSSELNLELFA